MKPFQTIAEMQIIGQNVVEFHLPKKDKQCILNGKSYQIYILTHFKALREGNFLKYVGGLQSDILSYNNKLYVQLHAQLLLLVISYICSYIHII